MSILISFTQYIQDTKLLVACFALFSHCSSWKVQMAHISHQKKYNEQYSTHTHIYIYIYIYLYHVKSKQRTQKQNKEIIFGACWQPYEYTRKSMVGWEHKNQLILWNWNPFAFPHFLLSISHKLRNSVHSLSLSLSLPLRWLQKHLSLTSQQKCWGK